MRPIVTRSRMWKRVDFERKQINGVLYGKIVHVYYHSRNIHVDGKTYAVCTMMKEMW